ncbi:aminotransferase class V-fold PLP-dependent enzyme [Kutzneria albida]|uniref:Aminotransferase class V domain-containing protein n=1 Tax=Kutzneria albida DSM 43870 TaxID=1449976 RepID=W5WQV7_9PSEU|nr:aminotransferase class V-fold PLP-dependent enzyme [Kutzneria albida]AHI00570.1 hypothetical protein KALB_7212 [Kutzneria albida DSM 43870]
MRTAFGETFDVPLGYLNTASIGVPPTFVADAVQGALHRWRTGSDSASAFDAPVAAARAAFADLVGVDPSGVATGASVSQLVALVAASVPDGTRVLTAAAEFTSVSFPFAAQAHRGVVVTEESLDRIPHTMCDHDLLAVSVVQSADGSVLDLAAVREVAEATGTRVLLDVTQAAGWMPLDLGWADWAVGAAYKWLLSPRGAAWLWLSPSAREFTRPLAANWYAGESRWDTVYGLPLRLAEDARRFDLSPTWIAQVGAAAALPWLAALDLSEVRAHCVGLANSLLAGLGLPPGESAIISLDAAHAQDRLTAAGVRFALRDGRVRLACSLSSTAEDVNVALNALAQ